jgi:hypothetical protein
VAESLHGLSSDYDYDYDYDYDSEHEHEHEHEGASPEPLIYRSRANCVNILTLEKAGAKRFWGYLWLPNSHEFGFVARSCQWQIAEADCRGSSCFPSEKPVCCG